MWVLGTQTQGLGPVQKASHLLSLGFLVLRPLSLPRSSCLITPSRVRRAPFPSLCLFSRPDASSLGHPDVLCLPSYPDALCALSTPQYKAILSNHTLAGWISCWDRNIIPFHPLFIQILICPHASISCYKHGLSDLMCLLCQYEDLKYKHDLHLLLIAFQRHLFAALFSKVMFIGSINTEKAWTKD